MSGLTCLVCAEAGIGHAALIVLAAVALILMAVLSAIGICERCNVQSGGKYAIALTQWVGYVTH